MRMERNMNDELVRKMEDTHICYNQQLGPLLVHAMNEIDQQISSFCPFLVERKHVQGQFPPRFNALLSLLPLDLQEAQKLLMRTDHRGKSQRAKKRSRDAVVGLTLVEENG